MSPGGTPHSGQASLEYLFRSSVFHVGDRMPWRLRMTTNFNRGWLSPRGCAEAEAPVRSSKLTSVWERILSMLKGNSHSVVGLALRLSQRHAILSQLCEPPVRSATRGICLEGGGSPGAVCRCSGEWAHFCLTARPRIEADYGGGLFQIDEASPFAVDDGSLGTAAQVGLADHFFPLAASTNVICVPCDNVETIRGTRLYDVSAAAISR